MTVKATFRDGQGISNSSIVDVSSTGELIIGGEGAISNKSAFQSMTTTGAFNLFGPIAGHQFVVTGIALDGPANATVSIYEAGDPSSLTIVKLLFKMNFRVAGQLFIPFRFASRLVVNEGAYINAFTDLATVNLNMIGYYHAINVKIN